MPEKPGKFSETSKHCFRRTSIASNSTRLSQDSTHEHFLTPIPNQSVSEDVRLLLRSTYSRRYTPRTSSNTFIVASTRELAAEISPLRFPVSITPSSLTSSSSSTTLSTRSSTDSSERSQRRSVSNIASQREQDMNRNLQLSKGSTLQSLSDVSSRYTNKQKRKVENSVETSNTPAQSTCTSGSRFPESGPEPQFNLLEKAYHLLVLLIEDLQCPSNECPGTLSLGLRKPFVDSRPSEPKRRKKENQTEPSESDPFEMESDVIQYQMEAETSESAQCEMEAEPSESAQLNLKMMISEMEQYEIVALVFSDSEECEIEVESSEPEQCVTREVTSSASEQCETRKQKNKESEQAVSDTESLKSEQSASEREFSKSEQSASEREFSKSEQSASEGEFSKSEQSASDGEFWKSEQSASKGEFWKSERSASEAEFSKLEQSASEAEFSKLERSASEEEFSKLEQLASEAEFSKSEQLASEAEFSKSEQLASEAEFSKSEQLASEAEFSKSVQLASEGESSKSEQSEEESLKPKQCKNEGSPKDSKAAFPIPDSNDIDKDDYDTFTRLRISHERNEGVPSIDLTFESFQNVVIAIRSNIEFFARFLIHVCGNPNFNKKNFESFRFAYNTFREEEYPKVLELVHLSRFVLTEIEICELFEKQDDNEVFLSKLHFANFLIRMHHIYNTKLQKTKGKIDDLEATVTSIKEWMVHI